MPRDYTKTAAWFYRAAKQGDVPAQYALGRLYDLGQGVPLDYARAAYWWRKAAKGGDTGAQNDLGVL